MQVLQEFIRTSTILPLSSEVIDQTIDLRKLYKIKLPYAIIAATAPVHDLTLITRDTADFKQVAHL